MDVIVHFFKQRKLFFVFLLLEIICFGLLFYGDNYQSSQMFAFANTVRTSMLNVTGKVRSYLYLEEYNSELQNRLKTLEEERIQLLSQVSLYRNLRADTILRKTYFCHPAEVIDIQVNQSDNLFMATLGENNGIEKNMCVISHQGYLVGVVENISPNYNIIQPLINTRLKVSAYHKKSAQVGVLSWSGHLINELRMDNLPLHTQVEIGDTILTRGFTQLIPPDIPIGTVTDVKVQKGAFLEINIKPFVDFTKVRYVYVIQLIHQQELEFLKNRESNL